MDKQELIDRQTLTELKAIANKEENNVTRYGIHLKPTDAKNIIRLLEQEQEIKELIEYREYTDSEILRQVVEILTPNR